MGWAAGLRLGVQLTVEVVTAVQTGEPTQGGHRPGGDQPSNRGVGRRQRRSRQPNQTDVERGVGPPRLQMRKQGCSQRHRCTAASAKYDNESLLGDGARMDSVATASSA